MAKPFRIEHSAWLPNPPAKLWPIVGDTDRFNRSVGLPATRYEFEAIPGGGSRVWASARISGIPARWEEKPYEWTRPYGFEVERIFVGGPMRRYRFGARLVEDGAGSRATVYGVFEPRHALFYPVCRIVAGMQVRNFSKLLFRLGRDVVADPIVIPPKPIELNRRILRSAADRVRTRIHPAQEPLLDGLTSDLE